MSLAPGTRLGPYAVVSSLGVGGMGEVYRARDLRLEREVAIKVLPASFANDAERVARFEREAKTLATLNHPHIAQIYGLEQSADRPALVMELVDGEDLAARIARGPIPLDEALVIARQIVDALQAAHEAGIVHRDLKPANIKVRRDGTVKVLDFGLAKALETTPSHESPTITSPAITSAGLILGTAAYMAPEQARGKPVDNRADIWAFGCVLYEMLTGRQLFAGETVSDTIAAILSREATFEALPQNTPRSIRTLLRRCLTRDPRARLHHIADARLELDDVQADAPEHQTVLSTGRRGRYLVVTAVTAAAAGALAAYIAMQSMTPAAVERSPIHLAIPLTNANAAANGVLISPDGRHLVTVASGGAATLHALDGSPSRALDGFALCWSPDSRSLVLQRRNGELLRMDISGGPPVAFANLTTVGGSTFGQTWGCTWNREGTLLVDNQSSLYQIRVSGGAATTLQLDDDGIAAQRFLPRFLSDGRRFLYLAVAPNGQRTVRAGSLDSRRTTSVVASDAAAIYTDGHLLFQRGAALVAQPFDEQTLTLSGEPRAITSEAAPGNVLAVAMFDVSRTGMLVYATTNGGVTGQPVWFDRRGNVLGAVPKPDGSELLNFNLSPDGTRVVGTRMDPSTGNWDIWMIDLGSGIPSRLTTQPGVDADAVWSPDGSQVAYVSSRGDASGIYRLSVNGGSEQMLLKSGVDLLTGLGLRTTDWTRDGRFIVYERQGDIMALPIGASDGSKPVVATPANERNGRVSPNGRWIAFQSLDSADSYIYVQPFPGPGARIRVSVAPGYHPQWREDGAELLWVASSPQTPATQTVYAADLTFGGNSARASSPKLVLPPHVGLATLIDTRPHWTLAADGQRFLLRQVEGVTGPAVKVILNWQLAVR
jgi:dipeptidyl aminopeptidase/acylaminoacyl peptidase